MRRDTQDINATSLEMYDENIDVYQGQLEGVEDLEIEIPEDMEDPEGLAEQLGEESGAVLSAPSAPTDGTGGQSVNSGAGATTFGGMTNGAGTAGGSTTANTGADDDKKKKVQLNLDFGVMVLSTFLTVPLPISTAQHSFANSSDFPIHGGSFANQRTTLGSTLSEGEGRKSS